MKRFGSQLGGMLFVWTALLFAASAAAQADALFSLLPGRVGPVTGIAAFPDGSFVFSRPYSQQVIHAYPDSRKVAFAGTGSPGIPVDGAPATRTRIYNPEKLALAGDGSLLIALPGYACSPCSFVARVAPDGTITKVAGQAEPSSPGSGPTPPVPPGGSATDVRLGRSSMEPIADGGFYLADAAQVYRVDPAGSISTVATESNIADVAALPDGTLALIAENRVAVVDSTGTSRTIAGAEEGGFRGDGGPAISALLSGPQGIEPTGDGGLVIADTENGRVRRIGGNRRIRTLAGGGGPEWCDAGSGYFRGDGLDGSRASLCGPVDMVRDPLGGWLIAHQNGVSFLASPDTRRLGVAITRPEADRGRLTFVATTAGSATVEVIRRDRTVASRTVQVSAGPNSVRLPRRLAGVHTFNLRAENADSADGDNIRLLLGGRLPLPLGEALIERTIDGGASRPPNDRARAADGPYEYLDRCRQFGSRRVDCVVIDQVIGGCSVSYLRLRPTGLLRRGSYRCRSGRRFREQLPRGAETYPFPL